MAEARQPITLDQLWENICNDLEQLFRCQTIRYSQWMQVYTCIFNYCSEKISNGNDLYGSIRDYLRRHLESLCGSFGDLHDRQITEYYIEQWHKYRRSSKILHGICSYFHRHYLARERDSDNMDIHEIYQMAIRTWHEMISKLFYEKISTICLAMIRSERDQQKIDTELIRNIIQIYVTFHIDEHVYDREDDNDLLGFYQKYFEDQFLNDTADFYRLKAKIYLQQYPVIEYIRKISDYLREETDRITRYSHSSTLPKLTKTLESILIFDQLSTINDEAKNLIGDEKVEELNLLYQTVNRVENGTDGLKNLLENHIHPIAIDQINQIPTNDLKTYIQTISNLHKKYLEFIQKTFDDDPSFLPVLDRTFRRFINHNAFVEAMGGMTSMAQFLACHCDRLLRKGRKEQIDLEMIFPRIEIILYYMQEKDVFEKFYSKLLAKRLIGQKSISNDYEKSMILTIQNACGLEYVAKMKQMCQDIETSEHLLQQYSQTEHTDPQIKFGIFILNSNAWLLSTTSSIILPNQLQTIFDHFTKFYQQIYNGRKLTWLYQHSRGELQTHFTDKIYTLQVSMYQMTILLLFNNSSEWTVENIHDQTQIKMDLLLQILGVLLRSKILIRDQDDDQIQLDWNSTIRLANEFLSDKFCINLNVPMMSIKENDEEVFQKKINHDRIVVIQAAIVRIMKSHQMMNQNLLIQTVIEQLDARFHPDIAMIKECINTLIKREYLQRSPQNSDLLCYMN